MRETEPALTARIDGEHVVVSTDDGTTSTIEGGASAIPWLVESVGHGTRGVLTAAALGTLAEARQIRPEPVANPPALPDWPSSRGERIPRRGPTAVEEAMGQRRSTRYLRRCHVGDVGSVLQAVARVSAVRRDPGGGHEPLRPVPSAGARHPIDVVVAARSVQGLTPGWWRFDPWRGQFAEVKVPMDARVYLDQVGKATVASAPGAALVLIASFDRTLSRYPAGSSLVWRDAGVMAGYLQLSASSRGLASCILSPAGLAFPAGRRDDVWDLGCVAVGADDSLETDR